MMSSPTNHQRADGEKSLAALSAAAAKIVESTPSNNTPGPLKATRNNSNSMKQRTEDNQLHPMYGVQPFIAKLYQMINSCHKDHPHIASWDDNGQTFVVKDTKAFASVIMPNYMQTKQFDSFIRNLNFYDFHKIHALPIPKSDQDPGAKKHVKYRHPNFQRDKMDLVREIKRSTRKVRNAAAQQEKEMDSLNKKCERLEARIHYLEGHVQSYDRTVAEMERKIATLESAVYGHGSDHPTTTTTTTYPPGRPTLLPPGSAAYQDASSIVLQSTNHLKPANTLRTVTDESSSETILSIEPEMGTGLPKIPIKRDSVVPATDQRQMQSKRRKTEKLGAQVGSNDVVDLRPTPRGDNVDAVENRQRFF